MKKFLRRSMFFIIPLLAIVFAAEFFIRNIPNDYKLKAAYYREHGDEIETLILGNSYGFYDFDPSHFTGGTFNGAHVAQTLDLDAAIFAKYAITGKNLKRVIVPVSDESFYFRLFTATENWRIKNYSLYYHLHLPVRATDYSEVLSLPFSINRNRLISYYLNHETPVTISPAGFGLNFSTAYRKDLVESASKAVAEHRAKNDAEMEVEKNALMEIIAGCAKRNIDVILIIPPVSHEYDSMMSPLQINKTREICQSLEKTSKTVRFLDFRTDKAFSAAEFFDADHLNGRGAAHLSGIVSNLLGL